MEPTYSTPFSKATLTGLFLGIFSCVACIAYNIFFRESTGFPFNDYINVSSLIFGVNLLFLVLGMLYYAMHLIRKGDVMYVILLVACTGFFAIKAAHINRASDPNLNTEFHELLVPIVIILGICAIGIPLLYHSRKFEEHVL